MIDNKKKEWIKLHHKDHDGIGGFIKLYAQRDTSVDYGYKENKWPSLLQKIKSLGYYNPESKLRHTNWRKVNRNVQGENVFFHYELSENEVTLLSDMSRSENTSKHLYCLWKLDQIVQGKLLENENERWWMLPVNMRQPLEQDEDQNFASYVSLQITNSMKPIDLYTMMVDKLKKYYHWAAWFWMYLIQLFGKKAVWKSLEYFDKNNHGWCGTFTNINIRTESTTKIFALSPVTKAHPIACSLITNNGAHFVSLHFHRSLKGNNLQDVWECFLNSITKGHNHHQQE